VCRRFGEKLQESEECSVSGVDAKVENPPEGCPMKRTQVWGVVTGSLAAFVLAIALGQDVRGAARIVATPSTPPEVEVSRSSDPSPSTTPGPDVTPTPTPAVSPTTTPSATPVPAPTEEPPGVPFDALIQAQMAWDQLEMFEPGPAPDPTWSAEFDGGQLVNWEPVQTSWLAMWEVDVPSPGGSVTATVTAGPSDRFRVVDVMCMVGSTFTQIPSTVHGQSVVFAFDAVPDGHSTYECYFTFDPALLPRPTPYPNSPSLPPTDTVVSGAIRELDGSGWLPPAMLVGVVAGAIFYAAGSRRPVKPS
jgi:hypothetical protein